MEDTKLGNEYFEAKLLAAMKELEDLADQTFENRKAVELDQSSVGRLSRMHALQSQAMALATQRRRQDQLLRISGALQRIRDSEYGYCVSCGELIDRRRLELDPTALSCVACTKR